MSAKLNRFRKIQYDFLDDCLAEYNLPCKERDHTPIVADDCRWRLPRLSSLVLLGLVCFVVYDGTVQDTVRTTLAGLAAHDTQYGTF